MQNNPLNFNIYSLLNKPVELTNYSQTEILVRVHNYGVGLGPTTDYFFNKHMLMVELELIGSPNPAILPSLFILTQQNYYAVQFGFQDVINPVVNTSAELLNIINGWLSYVSGVSVNGGTSTGLLNTINLIEGPNITITAVPNVTTNVLDVTVSAAGGSGEDPFPKILMLMGG